MTATGTLVLLRHGESEWNKANLFTGWVDVALSEQGRAEAIRGGRLLGEHGLLPDVCTPRCCAGRSPPRSWPSRR